ncbi:MAG: hypothetical protein WBL68_02350 [Nitrososphaeraceae archaeon]
MVEGSNPSGPNLILNRVEAIDAIGRIVCKRFHGFSNLALACAISLSEALVTSNFARLWWWHCSSLWTLDCVRAAQISYSGACKIL